VVIKSLLRYCYITGELYSDDPSTRTSATLVDTKGDIVALAVNSLSHGYDCNDLRLEDRNWKYEHMEHAERRVLFDAAKAGICTRGLTLVAPWAACPDCARAIVLCGVTRVVVHRQAHDRTPERWKKAIEIGLDILDKGGVQYLAYDGIVGHCKNTFDRKIWYP